MDSSSWRRGPGKPCLPARVGCGLRPSQRRGLVIRPPTSPASSRTTRTASSARGRRACPVRLPLDRWRGRPAALRCAAAARRGGSAICPRHAKQAAENEARPANHRHAPSARDGRQRPPATASQAAGLKRRRLTGSSWPRLASKGPCGHATTGRWPPLAQPSPCSTRRPSCQVLWRAAFLAVLLTAVTHLASVRRLPPQGPGGVVPRGTWAAPRARTRR